MARNRTFSKAQAVGSRLVPAVAAIIVLVALSGCCPPGQFCGELVVTMSNDTDETVVVSEVEESGREYPVETLVPGQVIGVSRILNADTHCTTLRLEARTTSGDLIATREPPLCTGEQWVIRQSQD